MEAAAGLKANAAGAFGLRFSNPYRVVGRGPVKGADGRWRRKLKWVEDTHNLVTTEGLNDVQTKYFKASGYTAAFYVGVINNSPTPTLAGADTAAQIGGSNDWTECTAYDEATRQALTLGSASAGSINNSAAKATFTINGSVTLYGCFLSTAAAKNSASGVLYGEVAFLAPRVVIAGDTVTVAITLNAASA